MATPKIPSYKEEFPDFGTLDVRLPEGFRDNSWHNDTMPCFVRDLPEDGEGMILIWTDYVNQLKREVPGNPRFFIQHSTRDGDPVRDLLATDNWDEVLDFVSNFFKED
jgi:hypothetical protein